MQFFDHLGRTFINWLERISPVSNIQKVGPLYFTRRPYAGIYPVVMRLEEPRGPQPPVSGGPPIGVPSAGSAPLSVKVFIRVFGRSCKTKRGRCIVATSPFPVKLSHRGSQVSYRTTPLIDKTTRKAPNRIFRFRNLIIIH